ncbi:MAG: arginine--tRNA ligase [Phycisphaeraceae bacterium]|nr:arginine--tRNA ligase [Phycisphaeraceae bacterium]
MADVTTQLKDVLSAALVAAYGDAYANADPMLGPANNPKFGDYQANLAMKLGKQLGKPPREVAQAVVDRVEMGELIEEVEIAGPGFINLHLSARALASAAHAMLGDDRLGVPALDEPQTVVVDYSSPNVAKEMHVGHLRSTVIGDAIARVLTFQGHNVIRQNHVGDWGTQFGMLIEHLLETGQAEQESLGDLTKLYKESKKRFDAEPDFAERAKQRVVALQGGDEATLAAWKKLVSQSETYFASIYQRMGVLLEPGDIRGESFYNDKLPGVVDRLKQDGKLETSQGAGVVFVEGFSDKDGDPLPMIVQKSDGGYLYATTDLAAIRYRVDELKASRIVYVTDARQSQHFAMAFRAAEDAGWFGHASLEHVPFGTVMGEDGKPFKTRDGDVVRLVDLIDEAESRAITVCKEKNPELTGEEADHVGRVVGLGSLKYADLSSDRVKDYKFSWDRMLALDGNTAPYLINAYVRVHGIFRKGEIDFAGFTSDHVQVQEPAEKALVLKLMQFGSTVDSVADSLEPHRMCNYLYELASAFHKFFESCPVLKSDVPLEIREGRLALCKLVALTLERGLGLLGIGVVERM